MTTSQGIYTIGSLIVCVVVYRGIADPTGSIIPFQKERLEAVADALSSRDLDLVLLEEVRYI